MEIDEVIWVDIDDNSCIAPGPADDEQLRCIHHLLDEGGRRYCGGAKGITGDWPCKNKPRILVNKVEYATWKLTN